MQFYCLNYVSVIMNCDTIYKVKLKVIFKPVGIQILSFTGAFNCLKCKVSTKSIFSFNLKNKQKRCSFCLVLEE